MKLQLIRKEEVCVHREKFQVAMKGGKGVENRKAQVVRAVVQAMVTGRRSQRWWSSEEGIKEIGEKTVKHKKACVCMCACGIYVSHNKSCFSGFNRLFSNSFRCLRRLVEGSSSDDYISKLSDDILIMILSLLPAKDAVITSSLSTRWRFLWCNLKDLKFDLKFDCNDTTLDNITRRSKFVSRVNSVIRSYNRPTINGLHIHDDLNHGHRFIVDQWLQFAANKKVETLELDFMGYHGQIPIYDFPSNGTVVSLKQLLLKEVNVSEAILDQFLKNSPHLETISIQGSRDLKHIRVGGRALNLKHFEIVKCHSVESIYLSDFELVSFAFDGHYPADGSTGK